MKMTIMIKVEGEAGEKDPDHYHEVISIHKVKEGTMQDMQGQLILGMVAKGDKRAGITARDPNTFAATTWTDTPTA